MPNLDTNALLRWLLGDVPRQTALVEKLLTSGESFVVDDAALIETIFVLEKVMKISRPTVVTAIRTLLSTASLDIDRSRWDTLAGDYLAHPKMSIADLYLAAKARESGETPLYSFDKKLAAQVSDVTLIVR